MKSYGEWAQSPSYHGSYEDYRRHMESMREYSRKEREEKRAEMLAEKIAEKLAHKLRYERF